MLKKVKKVIMVFLLTIAILLCYAFISQTVIPHKSFVPDYEKSKLTESSSFEEIFLQTGLGKSAAQRVLANGGIDELEKYQDTFFAKRDIYCKSLLGFVTKSDRLVASSTVQQLADVQKGDILITLSNHTLGWRHGHAGIAIDEQYAIESAILGSDSEIYYISDWQDYSQFAVMRLKDITPQMQAEVSQFAENNLFGVPYKLTSGYFGPKAPELDSNGFGVHCSYLVWYAYQNLGFDIDSDDGRLVSSYDILHSPLLEVVQIYGIDPRKFK